MSENLSIQALEALANPAVSLRAFGCVKDQKTKDIIRFDPEAITYELQNTVVSYTSNPPLNQYGQTYWLTLLGYRQGGKSLTAELCGYPKAAYTPGWDHVCIADNKDRAEYLHRRVQICHDNWPVEVRTKTISSREVKQKTFVHGGQMRVLSGEAGAVGIGQSPDYWHGSELGYWKDAEGQASLTFPSLINKDHCLVLFECTPVPMDAPSAEWWRDHCESAKQGGHDEIGAGRWLYKFFPFWDGKLNVRPWPKNLALESEEIRLLEKYGDQGLTKEHLAFRRLMMDTDKKIRKNPDLFRVYYPFDDLTCWLASSNAVIHSSVLRRHVDGLLVPWTGQSHMGHYQEYESPEAGAIYVLGVDPIGFGARDHGAFHVLKCFAGEWSQVAAFGGVTDPLLLAEKVVEVGLRYNHALVGVERNGVGEGFLALLIDKDYPNLYYDAAYKPGVWKSSESQMLSHLIDALKDELVLRDEDTVAQLGNYRNDRKVQRTVKAEIMSSGRKDRRRARHHWDKVSALAVAVVVARDAPVRIKKQAPDGLENVVLFRDMTYDQLEKFKKTAYKKESKTGRRAQYRSTRRRRR